MFDQNSIVLRVPADLAPSFKSHWKDLRSAEGLAPDYDLNEGIEVEPFDAAALIEWIVPLGPIIVPVIAAALGYVVATRGEIIVKKKDGTEVRIKNMTPSQAREMLETIESTSKSERDTGE
ncbi:hypothetical protein GC197_03585 [bacterium]|nr:hypothetical protein [bacterium]